MVASHYGLWLYYCVMQLQLSYLLLLVTDVHCKKSEPYIWGWNGGTKT